MVLDAVNKKILNMLLESGRISYSEIAKTVNMKPPSIIERISKMQQEGVITGYSAQINYKKLGYDITALIGVVIDNPENINTFEESVHDIDSGIVSCYHVTGDFTLTLRIITENTNTLSAIIRKLRNTPGVVKTNTILVLSTMMDRMRSV